MKRAFFALLAGALVLLSVVSASAQITASYNPETKELTVCTDVQAYYELLIDGKSTSKSLTKMSRTFKWEFEEDKPYTVTAYDSTHNTKTETLVYVGEKTNTPGNVTGDASGTVNGKDALRLAKYLSGGNVQINLKAADVNGDGKVDGRDLLRLARALAGQDVELMPSPLL